MDNHDFSKYESSLQSAISEEISEQCQNIRQECLQRFNEKVEAKVKELEAEHNNIIDNEISDKTVQLNDKFKNVEKQYNASVDERQKVESNSRSARMRYDKLNVRLMNSGLRIHQLVPKVEQMNPEWAHQRAVQSSLKFGEAIVELNNIASTIHGLQDERDELKAKLDLAQADNAELNESLNGAAAKLQTEEQMLERKEKELEKLCNGNEKKMAEVQEFEEQLAQVTAENEKLAEEIAELEAALQHKK